MEIPVKRPPHSRQEEVILFQQKIGSSTLLLLTSLPFSLILFAGLVISVPSKTGCRTWRLVFSSSLFLFARFFFPGSSGFYLTRVILQHPRLTVNFVSRHISPHMNLKNLRFMGGDILHFQFLGLWDCGPLSAQVAAIPQEP